MGENMLFLFTIFIVLLVFLVWNVLVWVWWKPMKLQRYLEKQGIKGHPYKLLLGNLKELIHVTNEALSKPMKVSDSILSRALPFEHHLAKEHGKLFVIWYGVTARVNIIDPKLIREILSNKFGHFGKIKPNALVNLLSDGVFSHNDEKWVKHRRIINPAFHQEKLKMMIPAFLTCCNELMSRWEQLVSNGSCELDVFPEFHYLTGDVISRAAFGKNYKDAHRLVELQTEQAEHVLQVIQSIYIPGFWYLPTKRNKRMKEINNEVCSILTDMIKKKEKGMKDGEAPTNDLLGLLLESNFKEVQENGKSKNAGITISEIIEECKLFYFAGHQTTSSLLVWTMVMLSSHPEWQVQAREEVRGVFGRREPDFDGLNHLKVVTMILYEVLRLYPPEPVLMRYNYKESRVGNISLPAGIQIGIPALLVHYDPEIWGEDVEEFNPRRFSDGTSKAMKNQISYFPFGWGPRMCIGQAFAMTQVKMVLASILYRFSFELSPKYVHTPYFVLTLQPQHGVQIIFHKL
ncbi:hypothetical protein Sjap_026005 [Stephania japonica]|uniref:Cytochrome P450 n=1 Tax=Stephania japonica TaxID=461633 RepID=A0AAP0E2T5_9MAGN